MQNQKKKPPRGTSFRISPQSLQRSVRFGEPVSPQSRAFNVKLYVTEAQELYTVTDCYRELTMKNLKSRLELLVGIPVNFQRLRYLDEVDLADDSTFRKNDIIPGGTLTMRIWPQDAWGLLVTAAAKGKIRMLQGVGASKTSTFNTANANLMRPEERIEWLAFRAFVALFITVRRRHLEAVEFLLQNGADLRRKTPLGRTALHVAVTSGHTDCINILLNWGAKISDEDNEGLNAVLLARLWGQKESERQLFRHQWQVRARQSAHPLVKPKSEEPVEARVQD
ncbi:ankyrin repeat domain-containing protein 60 [Varanus komodoensis]|uniref:ankyrin repeat domain-containing protein 60 n=1 Tax=Varanus komodoensis TaxID=61221 RepID=UPI001CF7C6E2|nr:ankyrin repeat domain-containing protein 60 [Varanus komodoensis]